MPSCFMVLVAAPGAVDIDEAAYQVRGLGDPARWSEPRCLADEQAYEIGLDAGPELARLLLAGADRLLGGAPIDVCLVPAAGRRKRLLVADMDSTIIEQECIDEMADVLGLKPRIAAITERAMRGELAFEAALTERLGLLAGISEDQLQAIFEQRITLMPGARTLIATMKAHGAHTALVSGGFTFFTSRVAAAVGFDENHANRLEMEGGRLTGRVIAPILGREAKLETLERLCAGLGIPTAEAMAIGDGANDLAMIRKAGLGVAYRAKPIVAAEAHASVAHGDLTALLYLQGYSRSEFIEG